jgi:hypothetical protein
MLIPLKYSKTGNEVQAKNVRTTPCKSRKQSVGAQPNTIQKPPDSDGSHTPPVASKAPMDSKLFQKGFPRMLRCYQGSETILRHSTLSDGHLNHARQDPNHQLQ